MRFAIVEQVAIIRREYLKDSEGFPVTQDYLLGVEPAQIDRRAVTDRWLNNAMLQDASAIVRIRMPRYSVTTDNVMVIQGRRYNILSVENVHSRNRWLVLTVREVPNG